MQVSDFPAILKADFGRFRSVLAVFRPVSAVSAVSATGRYVPIWPIRLDFGRISPIRRESKPIRHESSRIGANRAESTRIREKKKKKKTQTRSDAQATALDAGAAPLVPRPCFLGSETLFPYTTLFRSQTRSDARATASDAGAAPLVPRPCFLGGNRLTMVFMGCNKVILMLNSFVLCIEYKLDFLAEA